MRANGKLGTAVLLAAFGLPLAGCGQSGPLYLPPAEPAVTGGSGADSEREDDELEERAADER